jgi:pimeloyl-ACP methyl ester carboxylesterase
MVLDLAELVDQLDLAEVSLVGHSLGGNVCLRYAGLWPERVRRLASLEGIGPSPQQRAERDATPIAQRFRAWAAERRAAFGKTPRTFADLAEARERMRKAHPRLAEAEVEHLAAHAVCPAAGGRWRWKFDPLLGANVPVDLSHDQMKQVWGAIACPVLLFWGEESWASNPATDGRAAFFRNARVVAVPGAAHWLHYDRPDLFMAELVAFL